MQRAIRWMLMFGWIGGFVPLAKAQSPDPANQLARDIFKQLIEINTTDSVGNVTTAAEAMAQRLRAAGFEAKRSLDDGIRELLKGYRMEARGPFKNA